MRKVGWLGLLRGFVSLRGDLHGIRVAAERIAAALESQQAPQGREGSEADPLVTITYVDNEASAEMMDIETRLTAARGMPPTEDEIMAEWERRHQPTEPDPRPVSRGQA